MSLQAAYDALRQTALPRLALGNAELDTLIDSDLDNRRGLTLLARPPAHITEALAEVMADFKLTEPAQYYYPTSAIHLTILSIISCYSGFKLNDVNPANYSSALRQIIQFIPPFSLRYQGLTASPADIMVQGFPQGNGLQELRDAARKYFQTSELQQSIDKRYSIQTAHSTIIRFKNQLVNPTALLTKLKKYEYQFFGNFQVSRLELVYNDWYQRAGNTAVLDEYLLCE